MNKGTSSANALSIEQGRIKEQFQFINRCAEKFWRKKRVKSFSKKILLIKGITAQLFWTFYKRRKTFSYVVLHVCLFHPVKSNFIRNCVLTFFAIFLLFGLTPADWEWQSLWKLIWWFSENWNNVDKDKVGSSSVFFPDPFQKHPCTNTTFLISFYQT